MRLRVLSWLSFLVILSTLLYEAQARRIRVQPRLPQEEAEETIQYYAAEPQEDVDNRQRVVLVSSADQYNGLYGQPTASSRSAQEYSSRGSPRSQVTAQRVKETPKSPPVQTIRNYNKVNDDGSFTFGYEAADGSFKEETRGTDCVVRGKYGYVDPDGNKREFTYVSGNPCDPNAPKEEDDQSEPESAEEENIPANYPTRPIRPIPRPVARPISTPAPKPVTLFQNNYAQEEDEQPEPEQLLRPTPSPQYISRPQYIQPAQSPQTYQRPQYIPSSTPVSAYYRQPTQPSVTARPQLQAVSPTIATRTQLPATTFKPQLLQVAVTPRPSLLYTSKPLTASPAPNKGIDFDAEFQRFQQENNLVSPTPNSLTKSTAAKEQGGSVGQIYSSALIYDPATGQYKNQLYQTLPQSQGDFSLNQRIQPYVHQPTQRPALNLQQIQQQSPLYRHQLAQVNPQAVYQSQQSGLLFQNSAQLYAQQQKAREQASAASSKQIVKPASVYYIQPSVDQTGALGASQIDAFLRGHNIQF